MSFIKKAGAFVILLTICGYAAQKWDAHAAFEKTGEKLVRQLGGKILDGLGSASPSCRGYARIDTVMLGSGWLQTEKGSAVLYISGKNDSALSIRYDIESAQGKVYVKPAEPAAAQLSVMRFGINDCG